MKKIKLLFKTKNYTGAATGKTLKSSLAHTFRVAAESTAAKKEYLKWDEDLVASNRVYFGESFLNDLGLPKKRIVDFSEITLAGQNADIVNAIVRHYAIPGDRDERNRKLASAKFSLKKACQVPSIKHQHAFQVLLGKYFKGQITPQNFKDVLITLPSTCNPTRLLEKFEAFEAAKQQVNFPSQKSTIVQEGILTFPLKDPISEGFSQLSGELSVDELINSINKFLLNYFEGIPILAIVGHVDEVSLHVHYFIDGWCKGRLKETIPQKVCKMFLDKDMQRSISKSRLSLSQLVNIGENLQRSFYGFINYDLLQEKGLLAEISPEYERKSEAAKHRNADARKPINLRDYQRAKDLSRKEIQLADATRQEKDLLIQQIAELENKREKKIDEFNELAMLIREQREIVDYLSGEKLQDFVSQLGDAFKFAPQLTFTTDINRIINLLIDKYPLLEREFWHDLLVLGLAGKSAHTLIQGKNNNSER